MENTGKDIHFSTYSVGEGTQEKIKEELRRILEQFGCEELLLPIFSCLNELLVNAIKANYKNLYFENYSPRNQAMRIVPYNKALALFRLEMQHDGAEHLAELARQSDIKASLDVHIDNGVMYITVVNPSPMTEIETRNVLIKMKAVASHQELAQYYTINGEDPFNEGAGLGILFIGMMLRNLGLSSDSLTVSSDGVSTTASLSIPLTPETLETYRKVSAGD